MTISLTPAHSAHSQKRRAIGEGLVAEERGLGLLPRKSFVISLQKGKPKGMHWKTYERLWRERERLAVGMSRCVERVLVRRLL